MHRAGATRCDRRQNAQVRGGGLSNSAYGRESAGGRDRLTNDVGNEEQDQ